MRVLLDESLPRKLGLELLGHQTTTVPRHGWAGLKNGRLLKAASLEFDVLITGDRNLEFQQNLARLPLAVIVLIAVDNRIESLRPLVPELLEVLDSIQQNDLIRIPRS